MKRRDLGMAVLGAAAGVAGCSQPAKSLFAPEATAANVPGAGYGKPRFYHLQLMGPKGSSLGAETEETGWHVTYQKNRHVAKIHIDEYKIKASITGDKGDYDSIFFTNSKDQVFVLFINVT